MSSGQLSRRASDRARATTARTSLFRAAVTSGTARRRAVSRRTDAASARCGPGTGDAPCRQSPFAPEAFRSTTVESGVRERSPESGSGGTQPALVTQRPSCAGGSDGAGEDEDEDARLVDLL